QPRRRLRGSFGSPPSFQFTGKEWEAARDVVTRHNEQTMPSVRRFSQVQERIIQLAEAGLLITAIREKAGGGPTPIPPAWWNSERIRNRFDLCQMNPDDPYGRGSAGDRFRWIFVTRESLMSCASGSGAPSDGAQHLVSLADIPTALPLTEDQANPQRRL